MIIAVNTRLLLKNKMEGIGWFAFETLKRITVQHPEHHFYFIFDRPYDDSFIFSDNITPLVIGPQSRHPFLWYIWFHWSLALVLRRIKPDLFLSPEGYICLKTNVKTINVMHDIAYEHYPETVPALVKSYYKHFFPMFAKRADRIATVSQYSKNDIVQTYRVSPDKISVVYNGCNEDYQPVSEITKTATRQKWSSGKPYFAYVGSINPRKNIKNLLLAFDAFKIENTSDIKLLLVGKKGFGGDELDKLLSGLNAKTDIHFLGRVEDVQEVKNIISASIALTYISVFEGFGIPCLEAMRCGTAVITSNTSSMPEVCGEAAIYIDPFSVESIKEGMKKITGEPESRQDLITKGFEQAKKFSWQQTADLLWGMVEEVVKS
jgi:glycosyltransferase involved in cell wall biosynthesis